MALRWRALRRLSLMSLTAAAACGGADSTDPVGSRGSLTLTISSATLSIVQGASGSLIATFGRAGTFTGAISVAVEGLPPSINATSSPSVTAGITTSTITFTAAAGAPTGTSTITIRASGNQVPDRTAILALTVTAALQGAYSFTVNPSSITVAQGAQASTAATLIRSGGFGDSVVFSSSGAPNGMTIAFNPISTAANATTIAASVSNAVLPGTYPITIRGSTSRLTERTATLTVQVTQGGSNSHTTFRVCDVATVQFAAFQDGDGPWAAVPVSDNTFSFNVASGRGGVAYVLSSGPLTWQTTYFFGAQSELNNASATCVLPSPFTKTVTGSVANVGANEVAWVSASTGLGPVFPSTPTFVLIDVPHGMVDLVATRMSPAVLDDNGAQTANRAIIRRGINPSANSELPVLDFAATEAVTPATRLITVNNLGTDILGSTLTFQTAGGATAMLFMENATRAATRQVATLTPKAGDLHRYLANASAGFLGAPLRSILAYYSASADKSFTLGPPLGAATISIVGTLPVVRLRGRHALMPEYPNITVNYRQISGDTTRFVFVGATEAYLADSDMFDKSMADLSALTGWRAVFDFVQGASVTWGFTGASYSGSLNVLDGLVTTSASRSGSLTP